MRVVVKGRMFQWEHTWFEQFCSIGEIEPQQKSDGLIIHGNCIPLREAGVVCEKQQTLVSDLSSEEELWKGISGTCRNNIRHAGKVGVECKYFMPDIILSDSKLRLQFSMLYNKMYAEKGMKVAPWNEKEVLSYARAGCILFSGAFLMGEPLVFHSYIFGEKRCRLFQSCSSFRDEEREYRNLVGSANKKLHWEDLMFFRESGILQFDWGGISSLSNPNGIDSFKMSFGGEAVQYYNIKIPISVRCRFIRTIKGRN